MPSIFIKEAQLNSRSLLQEGKQWEVATQTSLTGPVNGIHGVPPVQGYVVTGTKGGFAQTPWVVPVQDGDDPLFAWWHYGLGKSIALTTDLGNRWAIQWPNWGAFPEFWESCVRWSMRGASPPNMTITSRVEDGKGIVDLEAVDSENQLMNFMQSKAVVINPSGDAVPMTLQQTGPGSYHAEFDAHESGAWLVNIAFQDTEGNQTGRIPTAITVPYPREYAATTHNTSLLQQIATLTGGRVLSFEDVEFVDLFDSSTLEQPISPQSMWDLLAMIAASFLVLDVAIRRLWIDKRSVQTMLAPVEKISSSSVDALRKVHQHESKKPKRENVTLKRKGKSQSSEPPKVHKEPESKIKEEEHPENHLGRLLKRKRERENPEEDQ